MINLLLDDKTYEYFFDCKHGKMPSKFIEQLSPSEGFVILPTITSSPHKFSHPNFLCCELWVKTRDRLEHMCSVESHISEPLYRQVSKSHPSPDSPPLVRKKSRESFGDVPFRGIRSCSSPVYDDSDIPNPITKPITKKV